MIGDQSRRAFMKRAAAFGMASSASAFVTQLLGISEAAAATATDYKALVCVFLFGGNDGNNTVIPVSISPQTNPVNSYANYAQVRGGLALPQAMMRATATAISRPSPPSREAASVAAVNARRAR